MLRTTGLLFLLVLMVCAGATPQVLRVRAADERAIQGYREAGDDEPVPGTMQTDNPVTTIAIGDISRIEVVDAADGT
jgi:hypothetical protein